MNEQLVLELATMIKVLKNEPLSYFDMERLIAIFKTRTLAISNPSQEELANLKAELLSVLQERFFAQQ